MSIPIGCAAPADKRAAKHLSIKTIRARAGSVRIDVRTLPAPGPEVLLARRADPLPSERAFLQQGLSISSNRTPRHLLPRREGYRPELSEVQRASTFVPT